MNSNSQNLDSHTVTIFSRPIIISMIARSVIHCFDQPATSMLKILRLCNVLAGPLGCLSRLSINETVRLYPSVYGKQFARCSRQNRWKPTITTRSGSSGCATGQWTDDGARREDSNLSGLGSVGEFVRMHSRLCWLVGTQVAGTLTDKVRAVDAHNCTGCLVTRLPARRRMLHTRCINMYLN